MTAFSVIALLGLITGLILSSFVPLKWMDDWVRLALMSLAMLAIVAVDAWGEKQLDITQKRSDALLRGAVGDIQVSNILGSLPDEFQIVNDFSLPGNHISHLVIGPTGIFLLETKNWRGIVSTDDKGELLLNGHPTDMPFVHYFVERVTTLCKKLPTANLEINDLVTKLFVFTSARLEMKKDAAGHVICLTDDQLYSYIVEKDSHKHLAPEEVNAVTHAFLQLIHSHKSGPQN